VREPTGRDGGGYSPGGRPQGPRDGRSGPPRSGPSRAGGPRSGPPRSGGPRSDRPGFGPPRGPGARPAAPVDAARATALRGLAHQAETFPQLDIAPLPTDDLSPRDAAFAHAIYDATLRRWLTLSYLLQGFMERRLSELESPVIAALLGGAAQMLLLDRVPPHAALNESVEWVKVAARPTAAGLVNAVLRRLAELVYHGPRSRNEYGDARLPVWSGARNEIPLSDGSAALLAGDVLPEDDLERLAAATSHSRDLIARWGVAFGQDEARRLAAHGLVVPPTILNTAFAKDLDALPLRPHATPGHHVFTGTRPELLALLGSRRDLWVQDAASTRAVASVADLAPGLVIDLCAGQGTKTRQLEATFPDARIVATDVDARRLASLQTLAAGSDGRIEVEAMGDIGRNYTATADLVLLDVPCSNTGVLPRRVEARYRCDAEQMKRLVELQRTIVADAMRLLRPGGAILYSTCSIDREENEDQAEWAARGGLASERTHRAMPAGLPGEDPAGYQDGSFSVLLRP